MFSVKIILAGTVIAIAITFIQWFFTGFLFHKYQALTPATWRKESSRSYAISTILAFLFSFLFAMIFSFWKTKYGEMDFIHGIEFGIICWITFLIPAEIGSAIYINYSRMFVFGRCLSSLAEYCTAGVIAVWLL